MNKKKGNGNAIGIICLIIGAGLIAGILFFFFGSKIGSNNDITYNFSKEADDVAGISIKNTNSMAMDAPTPEPTIAPIEEEDTTGEEDTGASDSDKKFYTYKVTTKIYNLRIRKAGSLTAKVIGWIPKGKTGYVYEKGDDWSLVEYEGTVGYSSNTYLDMTEIPRESLPESFPEEYR